MLSALIAGFLSCKISKTTGVIKLIFLYTGTYLLNLQFDDVILGERRQACPKRLLKLSEVPFSCELLYLLYIAMIYANQRSTYCQNKWTPRGFSYKQFSILKSRISVFIFSPKLASKWRLSGLFVMR